jgi:hypothetical protein
METLAIPAISSVDALDKQKTADHITVGYRASLGEISRFEESLNGVIEKKINRPDRPSTTEKAVIKPLDYINTEAENIVNYAKSAVQSGNELTPSEIVMLTTRSHEFMFHCQLTSNIANRTSEGLQQLFRQQS